MGDLFNPCYDYCYLKYGKQYTEECDSTCDYARVCLENKELQEREERRAMYNKKYYLEKIEEMNKHNPLYDDMVGCTCYLAYLNIGERGWFLWEDNDWLNTPHRIHTSVIKNVTYIDNQVFVETQNTKFVFTMIEGE